MASHAKGAGRPKQRGGEVKGLRLAGLFAGIGGIELGFGPHGHHAELLCEVDEGAQRVLGSHFKARCVGDIRQLQASMCPPVDLIAGGFPCQDLSQAGRTAGISGGRSSLVDEMFRVVEGLRPSADWLLIENVPFMLQLERGRAMHHLSRWLGGQGYTWAYRVVDARAFGLPQRRQRVILLASKNKSLDPREVLFADEAGEVKQTEGSTTAYGFYWTEGVRGLGWGIDCVPTLKGGSGIGIPSPPAIWLPDGRIILPDLRDAERLQGFPADWTKPALDGVDKPRVGERWRLVGNAVSVPVADWVARCLSQPRSALPLPEQALTTGERWPNAAFGYGDKAFKVDLSCWPRRDPQPGLASFLRHEGKPLSLRAATGFRARTMRAKLKFRPEFLAAVDQHIRNMGGRPSEINADTGRRPRPAPGS